MCSMIKIIDKKMNNIILNSTGIKDVPVNCLKNNVEEIYSDKSSASAQNGRKFLNTRHNNSSMYQRKKSICSRKMQTYSYQEHFVA